VQHRIGSSRFELKFLPGHVTVGDVCSVLVKLVSSVVEAEEKKEIVEFILVCVRACACVHFLYNVCLFP